MPQKPLLPGLGGAPVSQTPDFSQYQSAPQPTVTINNNTAPLDKPQMGTVENPKTEGTVPGTGLPQQNNGSIIELLNNTAIQPSTALAGQYGTQAPSPGQDTTIADKYTKAYGANKSTTTPDSGAQARSALDQHFKDNPQTQQEDPQKTFFDNYASMNPAVKTMYDTINHELSSTATQQTFKDEYTNLLAAQGIPALQTDLMNIQNVMKGTEDDIRNEITKTGGFATESQVQALTAARNKVLLKQASTLQQQLQLKEDYVNQIMQFSQLDRAEVNKQVDRKLGLVEKLATMTENINKSATANYEKIVDNIGYSGLAKGFEGNPQGAKFAEQLLGLPIGSLSNPSWLQEADTFKQQQLAQSQSRLDQSQQRINISVNGSGTGAITPDITGSQVDYYKTTGKLPSFGYGAAGQAARNAFWNAVASSDSNINSEAQLNKVTASSISKALGTQQNQFSATKTSLSTLDKQLSLLQTYSNKVDRSGTPILNKYILWTKGQVQGDADTAALQNIVSTAANEFAKILSGSAASIAGTTVSSSEQARELINANMTPQQINTIISQMRQEGQYRITSQQESIDQLKKDLANVGGSGSTTGYAPGTVISSGGVQYTVGDDGETLTPMSTGIDWNALQLK